MNPQPRLWWTFAITSLALFMFTLDRLVVTIALPAIRTDLGAQVADLEWTVNAYTLSFAVLLLTGGAWATGSGDAGCSPSAWRSSRRDRRPPRSRRRSARWWRPGRCRGGRRAFWCR